MPFIWNCKTNRISKKDLQKTKESGRFDLPCFLHSYWAANLRALTYWQEGYKMENSVDTPAWVAIEKKGIINSSLCALDCLQTQM